jgi:FtsZ-binding cell division protein ZapB
LENGIDALDNIKLVGSTLGGNAAAKTYPEYDALILCLIADYHKELIGADEALRDSVKESIAGRLHNNEGLDADLCNSTLNVLEAAIFGSEAPLEESQAESDAPQTPSVPEKTEPADTAAEVERLQMIVEEYKDRNIRLVNEITQIGKQKKQSNTENPQLEKTIKKTRNKFITTFVFLVISVIVIFVIYGNMKEKNTSLLTENYMLENEIIALKKQYEDSKIIWAINVTDMEVGNSNQNNKWITKPGNLLKASEVQYLNPVFIYDSPGSSFLTFSIKIKDPAGTVVPGEGSPEDFSYSRRYQVTRGTSLRFDPGGFGSARGGFYSPGTWTIELWHKDFCLYSGEIKLD